MEASYKNIQGISSTAEDLRNEPDPVSYKRYVELRREYQVALESSENHTSADYHRWEAASYWSAFRYLWRDTLLGLAPYISLLIPIVLLIPFTLWF
jgi:hypothetical protein